MPSTPTPERRRPALAVLAAAAATVSLITVLAGCGGSSLPAGSIRGAGGIAYQWPPADVGAPASQKQFCRLLIDDYQHLKSIKATTPAAGRATILQEFASFTPTVVAAAPASIAPAASAYLSAEGNVLVAAVRANFNAQAFDRSTLTTLSSPAVASAESALSTYAQDRCRYDLAANAALAPKGPATKS